MKAPGYLITTSKGLLGRTYHKEGHINGKVVVHIVNKNHEPLLYKNGDPMKLLCSKDSLKIIGHVN